MRRDNNYTERKALLDERLWLTKDKEYIPVNDMATKHLHNTINNLKRKEEEGSKDPLLPQWIAVLELELNARHLNVWEESMPQHREGFFY